MTHNIIHKKKLLFCYNQKLNLCILNWLYTCEQWIYITKLFLLVHTVWDELNVEVKLQVQTTLKIQSVFIYYSKLTFVKT